jgi:hypothetical protein
MATNLFKHFVGAPLGHLAQWAAVGEVRRWDNRGPYDPNDRGRLQRDTCSPGRPSALLRGIVRQETFPELRVEVRPIRHHLSVPKICRSGIGVGGKGRKSVPPPPGQKPAEETSSLYASRVPALRPSRRYSRARSVTTVVSNRSFRRAARKYEAL